MPENLETTAESSKPIAGSSQRLAEDLKTIAEKLARVSENEKAIAGSSKRFAENVETFSEISSSVPPSWQTIAASSPSESESLESIGENLVWIAENLVRISENLVRISDDLSTCAGNYPASGDRKFEVSDDWPRIAASRAQLPRALAKLTGLPGARARGEPRIRTPSRTRT